MPTITEIADRARTFGIETSVWNKAGRLRLYARTQKHLSVYLEFDGTPECPEGAAFKVFCNVDQHPNWIKSQIAQARAANMALFHAFVIETYADTGPAPNGYGPDINEMIDEARAFAVAHEIEMGG